MTSQMNPAADKTDHTLHWANLALAILGTIDSIYLLVYKYTSNDKLCLGSGGCATVNYSPYSEIYSLPVALFGIIGYAAMLAVLALEPRWELARQHGRLALFGMSLVGLLFSAYLTYIEAAILHAYCPFCVASAIIITILFALATIRLIKSF